MVPNTIGNVIEVGLQLGMKEGTSEEVKLVKGRYQIIYGVRWDQDLANKMRAIVPVEQ